MSEGVIVAIVGGCTTLAVTVVAAILAPIILSRLKSIEAQVANDHKKPDGTPLNLRDDLDGKHDENQSILLTIQRDVAWLMRQLKQTDDRVDALEATDRTKGPHH